MQPFFRSIGPLIVFSSIIILFMSGCRTAPPSSNVAVGKISTFNPDGAWCWFSDPRAVYFEGAHQRTYAGWVDSTGNIVVGYFDHQSGDIETYVLHEELEVDDHDNPALYFTEDGRLMVFYARHARTTPIYQMISSQPEDITSWEPRRELKLNDSERYAEFSDTYTYVNVWPAGDQLFMLWRGADFKPNFSISEDGGESWSKGQILILPKRIYRNRRPYLKAFSDGGPGLHLAFTDGHPRKESKNSIYYMYYEDGSFYHADGSRIGSLQDVPFAPSDAQLVHDGARADKAWIWDIAADQEGNPAMTYASFPNDSTHYYHYARWDDNRWNTERLTYAGSWFPETRPNEIQREPNYSGGIVLDHEDPSTVYMSVQRQGVFEIEQWNRQPNGEWDRFPITMNSQLDNVRPYAVYNAGAANPVQLLFLTNQRYFHYTDYRSSIKMWQQQPPR